MRYTQRLPQNATKVSTCIILINIRVETIDSSRRIRGVLETKIDPHVDVVNDVFLWLNE